MMGQIMVEPDGSQFEFLSDMHRWGSAAYKIPV